MQKAPLIIVSTLLVIIASGIGFMMFVYDPSHTPSSAPPATSSIPMTYAEQRADVDAANKRDSDIYNIAQRDQDPARCDYIADTEQRADCHDMISATTMRQSGTIESCDTLTSTGRVILCRDTIWSDRAIAAIDRSLCASISDTDRAQICVASVDEVDLRKHTTERTITREYCDTLTERYQSMCLSQIQDIDETGQYRDALTANDISLCDAIIEVSLRTTCQDTIRIKSAVSSESTTLCTDISDPSKRLYCETQVSKTSDITLYRSAITGTALEACTPIANANLRNKCHDTIIISRVRSEQDTTLCRTLTNTGMITSCQNIVQ